MTATDKRKFPRSASRWRAIVTLVLTSLGIPAARALPAPGDALALLESHCHQCHGGEKTQGGLDLTTREALMLGGESGAIVVPGKPDQSLLVKVIRHEKDPQMPRKADKLSESDIALIADWVKVGSPYERPLTRITGGQLASDPGHDPDNTLYGRMNRLRLEGEIIRDSLLAIGGKLNRQPGGPGVFPPIPKELYEGSKGGWKPNENERDHSRRSIYIFARRNLRFPFLEVFDAPDSNRSCSARERSTTAPQSLTMLNAEEVLAASHATAARLEKEAKSGDERIILACRIVLGRAPSDPELAMGREFLQESPLSEFCRVLFNLNDFVYLE